MNTLTLEQAATFLKIHPRGREVTGIRHSRKRSKGLYEFQPRRPFTWSP